VTILVDPLSFGGRYSSATLAEILQAGSLVTYHIRCGDDLTAALSVGKMRSRYQTLV
jgi:hypothetical protein